MGEQKFIASVPHDVLLEFLSHSDRLSFSRTCSFLWATLRLWKCCVTVDDSSWTTNSHHCGSSTNSLVTFFGVVQKASQYYQYCGVRELYLTMHVSHEDTVAHFQSILADYNMSTTLALLQKLIFKLEICDFCAPSPVLEEVVAWVTYTPQPKSQTGPSNFTSHTVAHLHHLEIAIHGLWMPVEVTHIQFPHYSGRFPSLTHFVFSNSYPSVHWDLTSFLETTKILQQFHLACSTYRPMFKFLPSSLTGLCLCVPVHHQCFELMSQLPQLRYLQVRPTFVFTNRTLDFTKFATLHTLVLPQQCVEPLDVSALPPVLHTLEVPVQQFTGVNETVRRVWCDVHDVETLSDQFPHLELFKGLIEGHITEFACLSNLTQLYITVRSALLPTSLPPLITHVQVSHPEYMVMDSSDNMVEFASLLLKHRATLKFVVLLLSTNELECRVKQMLLKVVQTGLMLHSYFIRGCSPVECRMNAGLVSSLTPSAPSAYFFGNLCE